MSGGNGNVVMALYRPHAGQEGALLKLVAQHGPTLRELEMITDRPTTVLRAGDGTFIEIFEWRSEEVSRRAHEHPAVARIWDAMETVGDFVALKDLAEAQQAFTHFAVVEL